MEYFVHYTRTETPKTNKLVGIEVQPPLGEIAAAGVAARLTAYKEGNSHLQFAAQAEVTRDDVAGTAFEVLPAVVFENSAHQLTSLDVAQRIGKLIDPCDMHRIDYIEHPPRSEQ